MTEAMTLVKNRTSSKPPVENITSSPVTTYNDIPIPLMNYFGVTPYSLDEETSMKLKDIYEHFEDKSNPDKSFVKLAEVERKIGKGGTERVIDKIWRYSKLQNQIKMLNLQNEALYG